MKKILPILLVFACLVGFTVYANTNTSEPFLDNLAKPGVDYEKMVKQAQDLMAEKAKSRAILHFYEISYSELINSRVLINGDAAYLQFPAVVDGVDTMVIVVYKRGFNGIYNYFWFDDMKEYESYTPEMVVDYLHKYNVDVGPYLKVIIVD